jgi:hypothetical protein
MNARDNVIEAFEERIGKVERTIGKDIALCPFK